MDQEDELSKMQRSFEVAQSVEGALRGDTGSLPIRINKTFDAQVAAKYGRWLLERAPNAIPSGAYALHELLRLLGNFGKQESETDRPEGLDVVKVDLSLIGIQLLCSERGLADIAACLLLVDIAHDVIAPQGNQVKGSLLSLGNIANMLCGNLIAARVSKMAILTIKPPFVANLSDELFVTVTAVSEMEVSLLASGLAQRQDATTFADRLTGYVLAHKRDIQRLDPRDVQLVSAQGLAFVWG